MGRKKVGDGEESIMTWGSIYLVVGGQDTIFRSIASTKELLVLFYDKNLLEFARSFGIITM